MYPHTTSILAECMIQKHTETKSVMNLKPPLYPHV
jgi:hypothetical protein